MEQRHNNQESRQSTNPCRGFLLSTFYFLPILLSLPNAFSQTFPLPGATWIFRAWYVAPASEYAEKWEYVGDSIVTEGVVKKIKITRKRLYNTPFNPLTVTYEQKYFLYSGDTITDLMDNRVVANFSLQVGDSAYTPYYTLYNVGLINTGQCGDSATAANYIYQKGYVTEAGHEILDGMSSRYYVLSYTNEIDDTVLAKYTERSIITQGYWHHDSQSCSMWMDTGLQCFYDDSSDVKCPTEDNWFETMDMPEIDNPYEIRLYPNPTADRLFIDIPDSYKNNGVVLKISGITSPSVIFYEKQITGNAPIDVSSLADGAYIYQLYVNGVNLKNGTLIKIR